MSLSQQHCLEEPVLLSSAEIDDFMQSLDVDWELDEDSESISSVFEFDDYCQTMAFVNAIAWIAQQENHHPELVVNFNTCVVRFNTHDVGGLSENDFICAAKVDALHQ